jgi:serine/threonine protein kinase
MDSAPTKSTLNSGAPFRNIKEIYKIQRTIGKGSFATVRKAKNRVTNEYVAVKVLSKRKMA